MGGKSEKKLYMRVRDVRPEHLPQVLQRMDHVVARKNHYPVDMSYSTLLNVRQFECNTGFDVSK